MRVVLQRVTEASVKVDGEVISKINRGLLVFLGISRDDSEKDFNYIANKIANLRIFQDDNGKFNLSLLNVRGDVLIVSQFTLYGDCRKGRRPSFDKAGKVEDSRKIYIDFINFFRSQYKDIKIKEGIFQADMEVSLVNDGPVTFILDSEKIL